MGWEGGVGGNPAVEDEQLRFASDDTGEGRRTREEEQWWVAGMLRRQEGHRETDGTGGVLAVVGPGGNGRGAEETAKRRG